MSHCIEALEASVALLVRQQNIKIEQQKNATLERKKYRKELDCSQKLFQEKLERELKIINNRQEMIKKRQEMIFAKQDQIQSTLHGETQPIQSPTTTVLASMSPPFTSPTASVAGIEALSKVHVPLQCEVTDICSMLSESDLDSILSLDWVTPFESQTNTATLQQGDGTLNLGIVSETGTAGTSHQNVFDAGTPHHGTVAESNPHLETTVVVTSHETVFDAGTLCHGTVTACIAGTPHHEIATAGPSHRETAVAGPSHHETATAGPSPCETAVAGPSHQRLLIPCTMKPPYLELYIVPKHYAVVLDL